MAIVITLALAITVKVVWFSPVYHEIAMLFDTSTYFHILPVYQSEWFHTFNHDVFYILLYSCMYENETLINHLSVCLSVCKVFQAINVSTDT